MVSFIRFPDPQRRQLTGWPGVWEVMWQNEVPGKAEAVPGEAEQPGLLEPPGLHT